MRLGMAKNSSAVLGDLDFSLNEDARFRCLDLLCFLFLPRFIRHPFAPSFCRASVCFFFSLDAQDDPARPYFV